MSDNGKLSSEVLAICKRQGYDPVVALASWKLNRRWPWTEKLSDSDIEHLAHDFGCQLQEALRFLERFGIFPWDSDSPMMARKPDLEPIDKPVPGKVPSGKSDTKPDLAPIGMPVPGKVGRKVNAAELRKMGTPELDYLPFLGQEGFIVRGWTTLIAGYPKAGKTELVTRLCHEWQEESVLYVTEEPQDIWTARLSAMPEGWEHVTLFFALAVEPEEVLAEIAESDATVVVIDTVRNLLRMRDETDNSEVARALTPYIAACREAQKTLILLHHIRKGGGQHGEGITGGHAFLGIVDAALEVLREQNLGESRRKVRGWGRVITIPELVYELVADGAMRALGDPGELALEQVKERTLQVLSEEFQTVKQIREAIDEPRPSVRQLRDALNALAKEGQVDRDPKEDKRGATYRYRLLIHEPDLERTFPIVPGQVEPVQSVAEPNLAWTSSMVPGQGAVRDGTSRLQGRFL